MKRLVDLLLEDDQPLTYMGVNCMRLGLKFIDEGDRQRRVPHAQRYDPDGGANKNFRAALLLQ